MGMLEHGMTRGAMSPPSRPLAGYYHNGPLSVIIPFGILGVIALSGTWSPASAFVPEYQSETLA